MLESLFRRANGAVSIDYGKVFLAVYAVLLPLMILPQIKLGGTFQIFFDKMRYPDLLLLLFSLFFITKIFSWVRAPENRRIRNIFLLLLLSWVVSTVLSKHRTISVFDTIGLCMLMALFVVMSLLLTSEDRFIFFNRINLYMAAFVAAIGITAFVIYCYYPLNFLEYFIMPTIKISGSLLPFRVQSTLISPEMYICYLMVSLVSGFITYLHSKEKKNLFLIAVISVGAFLGHSRSLAGFFVVLAIVMFSMNLKSVAGRIFVQITTAFTLALFTAAAIFTFYNIVSVKNDKEEATLTVRYRHENTYYYTLAALDMFKENPLFGIGPGSFTYETKNYVRFGPYSYKTDEIPINLITKKWPRTDPHCFYRGQLSETGVFGFGLILVFLGYLYRGNRLSIKECGDDIVSADMRRVIEAGLFGMLTAGLYVDIFSMRHLWLLFSMMYAATMMKKHAAMPDNGIR